MSTPSINVGGVEFGTIADLSKGAIAAKEGLETREGGNGPSGSLFGRFFRKSRHQRGKVEDRPSSNRVAEAPAEFLPIPRPLEPCEVDEPVISPRPEASGEEESRSLRDHLKATETHKGSGPTSPVASFEQFVLESLTKKHRGSPVALASTLEALRREGSAASRQDDSDIALSDDGQQTLRTFTCQEGSAESEQGELISRLQAATWKSSDEGQDLEQVPALRSREGADDLQGASQWMSSPDERVQVSQGANSFKLPEMLELRSSNALQGLESDLQTSTGGPLEDDRQDSPPEGEQHVSGRNSEGSNVHPWRTAEDGAGVSSQQEGSGSRKEVGKEGGSELDKESYGSLHPFDDADLRQPPVVSRGEGVERQDSRSRSMQHSGTTEVRGLAHWQPLK